MRNKKRSSRCTQNQKDYLCSFMTRHRGLSFSSFSSHQQHTELWGQLTEELNEMGPSKTVDQWKITWRHLKNRTKPLVYRVHRPTYSIPVLPSVHGGSVSGKTSSVGSPVVSEIGIGGDAVPMPTPYEIFESEPSSANSTSNDEARSPSNHNSGPSRLRRPLKTQKVRDLGQIYETCSNSTLAVLTDISNHMAERNQLEKDRNTILQKKNWLLERFLVQNRSAPLLTTIEEDE